MEALLSKKTALKRRASLSFLFRSQKPSFAGPDDKPTRYYNFIETAVFRKPSSTRIDRQDIPPELERKLKNSCSLLAYRIERGIPSPASSQVNRRTTREGPIEDISPKPQLQANYYSSWGFASKSGKPGYDSGIGLTQQSSMQTMRALRSRSGDPSDTDIRTISIFSNTRTGTSCSNTSAINSTALSYTQPSSQSPKRSELLQSMTGGAIQECAHQQKDETDAFLSGGQSWSEAYKQKNKSLADIEAFLNPAKPANFSCETLHSNSSPSLGLARVRATTQNEHQTTEQHNSYSSTQQSAPESASNVLGPETATTGSTSDRAHRSIIVDTDGRARLLTPDEESQNHKALQQAVIAKVTSGLLKYTPVREPSYRGGGKIESTQAPDGGSVRTLSAASQSSVSLSGQNNTNVLGWRLKAVQDEGRSRQRGAVPVRQRLQGFFFRVRNDFSFVVG
ncbi:hypothetical protein BJX61DRAFT_38649 [Aspergillus egyptiacus]|nr:hypothetical protein BJX61DRAFT_38649 [Aspergillus egyptiacus]